jgi:hypothetical protein
VLGFGLANLRSSNECGTGYTRRDSRGHEREADHAERGERVATKSTWTPGQYTDYFLSSRAMTVGVTTKDGKIIEGPPIVRKFIGQPLTNLIGWMTKHGDLQVECGPEYTPEKRQLKA